MLKTQSMLSFFLYKRNKASAYAKDLIASFRPAPYQLKRLHLAALFNHTHSEFSVPGSLFEDNEEEFLEKITDFEHVYVFSIKLLDQVPEKYNKQNVAGRQRGVRLLSFVAIYLYGQHIEIIFHNNREIGENYTRISC